MASQNLKDSGNLVKRALDWKDKDPMKDHQILEPLMEDLRKATQQDEERDTLRCATSILLINNRLLPIHRVTCEVCLAASLSSDAKAESKAHLSKAQPELEALEAVVEKGRQEYGLDDPRVAALRRTFKTVATAVCDPKREASEVPSDGVKKPRLSEESHQVPPAETRMENPTAKYTNSPMTQAQKETLIEKVKGPKRFKHSAAFLRPVDPAALEVPDYPEIIKNPMDLTTMDRKLKSDQYHSVQAFADDFELVVNNSRTFNTDNHPVTQAAFMMQTYFSRMMEEFLSERATRNSVKSK
jgi:hypothetical protein